MIHDASVNDQFNQDKRFYMENFQKGCDNRIEGLEDVLFVLGNEKDVKRDEYKVAFINKFASNQEDEAPKMTVHKAAPKMPIQTSSSSSSSGKMSPIPAAQRL